MVVILRSTYLQLVRAHSVPEMSVIDAQHWESQACLPSKNHTLGIANLMQESGPVQTTEDLTLRSIIACIRSTTC